GDEARPQIRPEIPAGGVAGTAVQPQCCAQALSRGLDRLRQLHPQCGPASVAAAAAEKTVSSGQLTPAAIAGGACLRCVERLADYDGTDDVGEPRIHSSRHSVIRG